MGNFALADVMPYHILAYPRGFGDMNDAEVEIRERDLLVWCLGTIGPVNENWKTLNNNSVFCFRNEEDAVFFRLKFS